MKKLILFAICMAMALSCLFGCGNGGADSGGGKEEETKPANGEITLWSASTAETVLLKKDISFYEKIRKDARVDVEMAKNEYEGAQIFLTATKDVGEYYVEMGTLKNESGKVFPAGNIEVYAYKYVETTFNTASHRNIGIGHYPDAILPIEASEKFGENKIEKGSNQGVYVRFETLPDTAAGTYTGALTVSYDGKSQSVPVSVKVWDVTVSEETRSKTLFSNKWNWVNPELDSTDERFQSYIDLMTEYRIGSINLININERDMADLDGLAKTYAQKVYEYVSDPRTSTYALEYFLSGNSFDIPSLEKFIIAIAEKSFETKFNCLEKATTYFGSLIDEATMQGKLSETITVTDDYRTVLNDVYVALSAKKDYYMAEYGVSEDFADEIIYSASHVPHIFVSNYDEAYAPYINEDGTGTGYWCPNVWTFQEEKNVERFMEMGLDWWYGCGGSSRPIPSYQLDDYTLSPRLMSWQQIYYGISGNLFWATNLNYNWENGWYADKEDYYTGAAGTAGVLGDGQLTYPGGQYELSRPVATRRLEAIRDGLEEYELLLDLKNKYAEVSAEHGLDFTFENVYSFVTANLFDGIRINASADSFYTSRNLMFQLLMLADSPAEVCITDVDITTTEIAGKCFVKDGYTLKLNGNAIPYTAVSGGKIYSFNFALEGYTNTCTFTVPELSGYNSVTVTSKGKAVFYGAENTLSNFNSGYVNIEKSLVNADIDGALSEKLVKVNVEGLTDSGRLQGFKYTDANVSKLGEATSSMTMRIYNGSGEVRGLSLMVKYKGDPIISQLVYVVLDEGWNTVEIKGVDQKAWSNLIAIDYLLFLFEANDDNLNPAINDLYFDGYYITYLREVN